MAATTGYNRSSDPTLPTHAGPPPAGAHMLIVDATASGEVDPAFPGRGEGGTTKWYALDDLATAILDAVEPPDLTGYATTSYVDDAVSPLAAQSDLDTLDGRVDALELAPPAHDHDDRYYTEAESDALLDALDAAIDAVADDLAAHKIAADPHAGYALLAGRAGGQTISGGTASGESLTLQSTSDATKGTISLAPGDTTITTPESELILSQTGDVDGPSRIVLRNRTGQNGAIFETLTNPYSDLAIAIPGGRRTIRVEGRVNEAVLGAGNLELGDAGIGRDNRSGVAILGATVAVKSGSVGGTPTYSFLARTSAGNSKREQATLSGGWRDGADDTRRGFLDIASASHAGRHRAARALNDGVRGYLAFEIPDVPPDAADIPDGSGVLWEDGGAIKLSRKSSAGVVSTVTLS